MTLPFVQLEITRPLLLAALAALPLLVYCCRGSLVRFAAWQRNVSLAVRVVLVFLLVLAICGIRRTTDSPRALAVLAVDESASIGDEAWQSARAFVDEALQRTGGDRAVVLPFAAEPGSTAIGVQNRVQSETSASNLAGAILAARAEISADYAGQIVVLSDGNQTDGNALAAAKAAGVHVSTVPLPGCPGKEVYVSDVIAPGEVREGEPFDVEVVIQSTHDDEGTVQLLRGPADGRSKAVAQERKKVVAGENRFRFAQAVAGERMAAFTARIEGFRDTAPENNQAAAVVFFWPKPRILLVESQPALAKPLAAALEGENIEVDVRAPDDMPTRPDDLNRYDLLILSNVPATSLPEERMKLVQTYVRDGGGGLVVVGGDRAFTPGGYPNTILEDVLPVASHVRKDKPKPGLALVLVIDCSVSMQGNSIELAKQASRQAVEMLGPRDKVGIIAFEDQSRWISEIRPCSDKKPVLERIGTITVGGRTNMYPAMEKAHLALRETYADLKHIIVMTDGISDPDDFTALTRKIAASGITVSTVGVGPEAAQALLEEIAADGKGHSYFCNDAAAVPRIFALETAAAGKIGITEEPFSPKVVHASPVLAGVDFDDAPTLLGYAETQAKPKSEVILGSAAGDPLLVSWRYGKGTSVAFTSDVQSRWAAAWLRRPDFGRFWVQVARHAMRPADSGEFVLHLERKHDRARITLDARDSAGRYLNGADAAVKITDAAGQSRETPLTQVAPGAYAAEFPAATPGAYCTETTVGYQGKPRYVGRRGLVVGYPDELRLRPTNTELLRSIASATGGQYNPEPAALFAPSGRTVPRTTYFWPYFLAAAALLFLADVALRRIDVRRREE